MADNPLRKLGHDEQSIESLYHYSDPESGFRTMPYASLREPWNPSTNPDEHDATVEGRIYGPKNEYLGDFSRHLDTDENGGIHIHHDSFSLDSGAQDAGFSKRWLNQQLPRYAQAGVKSVSLFADVDIGPYAWLKHGFTPDDQDRYTLRKQWQADLGKDYDEGNLSDDEYAQGMRIREPHQMAEFDVGRQFPVNTAQGEQPAHYGKAFFLPRKGYHGSRPWHGTLNLDPQDEHYQRGQVYRSQAKSTSPEPLARSLARKQHVHAHRHQLVLCERGHIHHKEGVHLGTNSDAQMFD